MNTEKAARLELFAAIECGNTFWGSEIALLGAEVMIAGVVRRRVHAQHVAVDPGRGTRAHRRARAAGPDLPDHHRRAPHAPHGDLHAALHSGVDHTRGLPQPRRELGRLALRHAERAHIPARPGAAGGPVSR